MDSSEKRTDWVSCHSDHCFSSSLSGTCWRPTFTVLHIWHWTDPPTPPTLTYGPFKILASEAFVSFLVNVWQKSTWIHTVSLSCSVLVLIAFWTIKNPPLTYIRQQSRVSICAVKRERKYTDADSKWKWPCTTFT